MEFLHVHLCLTQSNLSSMAFSSLWPLTWKRSLRMNAPQAHGREMDTKPFEMEWLNGWRKFLHGCSQMGGQMKKIFARIHVCRKFLHGCSQTDTCLMKIFERILWLNEWTANKNFWTDKVEQINNWRKYFLKDEQLKKIILFLNGCGWSVRRPKKIIMLS